MRRFFTGPENIGQNIIVIDDHDDIHHIMNVLRLKEGDEIDVSDKVEWEYRASIISMSAEEVQLRILDKQTFASEPLTRVTLFQGIPRQGKMETVIQKTTELGIHRIVPVFMDRTVVVNRGNFDKKTDRWQKVADEAAKQCKRGTVPNVSDAAGMRDVIGELADFDLVIMPYENEKNTTIKDVLLEMTNPTTIEVFGKPEHIAVIIGPEGGFSDEEAKAIVKAGGKSVSLGKTILRTETAAIAAVAMIMYELEL